MLLTYSFPSGWKLPEMTMTVPGGGGCAVRQAGLALRTRS